MVAALEGDAAAEGVVLGDGDGSTTGSCTTEGDHSDPQPSWPLSPRPKQTLEPSAKIAHV